LGFQETDRLTVFFVFLYCNTALLYFFSNRRWRNPDNPEELALIQKAWQELVDSSVIFAGQCKFERLCKVIRTFRSEWHDIETLAKSAKKCALPRRPGFDEMSKAPSRKRKLNAALACSSASVSPYHTSPVPESNPTAMKPALARHTVGQQHVQGQHHVQMSTHELAQMLVIFQAQSQMNQTNQYIGMSQPQYLAASHPHPTAVNTPERTYATDHSILLALLALVSSSQQQAHEQPHHQLQQLPHHQLQQPSKNLPTLAPLSALPRLSETLAGLSSKGGDGGREGSCNALPHISTHCNTLQHNHSLWQASGGLMQARSAGAAPQGNGIASHCNALQHTATHCSTLQHTSANLSTLQRTAGCAPQGSGKAWHCNNGNTLQHGAPQGNGNTTDSLLSLFVKSD